jgi:hypothetical protein
LVAGEQYRLGQPAAAVGRIVNLLICELLNC